MSISSTRRRRPHLVWGAALLAAGVALGAVILFVRGNGPFAIDSWWDGVLSGTPEGLALQVAMTMDVVGGGGYAILWVPLVVVAGLLLARRPAAAGYFVVAELASAGSVQVLKHVFGRARPEDILVTVDAGSFPSGHVANAATLAIALWVILPRSWMAVLAGCWIAVMAFSRTYVSAHWLSDTAGGALVGAGVALLVAAAFAPALAADRRTAAPRSRRD